MHKVAGARQAMEAVGAKVLYLSPYSPDLNPTKMALTEPKALVRLPSAHFQASCAG
jgi:transposase